MSDDGGRRKGWRDRLFEWLLGDDADWVLGDLEEGSLKRRGLARYTRSISDVLSLVGWALVGRRTRRREGMMRGMHRSGFVDAVRQDVRHPVVALRRDLAFAVVVILTLGIGIGANPAVFGVVHSVLLRPLPYTEPDRLVTLWTSIPERGIARVPSAYGNIQDWKERSHAFEALATYDPATRTLTGGDWAERVGTADASATLFSVLGVEPAIGRTCSEDEERRRAAVVVLSHDFWVRRFSASSASIGKTVEIDRRPFQVIGVLPEDFAYAPDVQLWLPETVLSYWDDRVDRRGTDSWRVLARLAPGASVESAQRGTTEIAERLERDHPSVNAGLGVSVVGLRDQVTGSSLRLVLWTLYSAVVPILLIACANVAHLIVARGVHRRQELSLRVALGATTSRLVGLALTEIVLLSVVAGLAGLLLAGVAMDVLVAIAPPEVPQLEYVGMNLVVLTYGIGIAMFTGVVAGAWPSLSRARTAVYDVLRGGRGAGMETRGRQLLVAAQFALSLVLVFGTSLLVRSLAEARGVDLGFDSSDVFMANLPVEPSDRVAVNRKVVENVVALPGVTAASVVEDLFIHGAPNRPVETDGSGSAEPVPQELRIDAIDGPFFRTLGMSIREGRDFTPAGAAGTVPVAIVNETMAGGLWPGRSPVGQRFRTPGSPWIEVVGVIGDMGRQGFERDAIPQAFRPHAQSPSGGMNLLVRTDGPVVGLAAAIRATVAEIDKAVPVYFPTTVDDALDRYLGPRRFQVVLLGLFSTIALLLAAIGIYGLVRYFVSQRTREMGIRLAVGAQSGELVRMVVRQGLSLAVLGPTVGMAIAFFLSRAITPLLFDIGPSDPTTVAATSAVLLITAAVACYIPARRAARVDPVIALREM